MSCINLFSERVTDKKMQIKFAIRLYFLKQYTTNYFALYDFICGLFGISCEEMFDHEEIFEISGSKWHL